MGLKVLSMFAAEFVGLNGSGSISVPGVKVGDVITLLKNVTNGAIYPTISSSGAGPANAFELAVTVDDEVQQLAVSPDYSGITIRAVFSRIE